MTQADTVDSSTTPASAAGDELSVPKYRLDEVTARLRQKEEEMAMKDRLYLEDRDRFSRATQPQQVETEITPEETGLDPQTHQAVLKAAKAIAGRMIQGQNQQIGQQIGILANRTERAELVASRGKEALTKAPEIERMQKEHYQRTGGFLPMDTAFDIIESKSEKGKLQALSAEIEKLKAQLAGKTVEETETPQATGVPNATATRQIPGGGPAPAGKKSFAESSLEEMEAALETQFRSGATL